jgi:hypothetical protein
MRRFLAAAYFFACVSSAIVCTAIYLPLPFVVAVAFAGVAAFDELFGRDG